MKNVSQKGQKWTVDVRKEALEAEKRIREHIRETPAEFSPYLSRLGNCRAYLKLENLQITGSFKLRGAMNKFLSLDRDEKARDLVTASSGNHGAAFAYVLQKFGVRGTVFLPENASQAKVEALRLYEADLEFHGDDCIKSEMAAMEAAERQNRVFVSPYNDLKIIGGQATIGIELERQLEKVDTVLVPVGGGGLISGVAGYLKSADENIEIVGCQPENSAVMVESIKHGEIIEMPSKPTLSDGTAGGIERGTMTFDICRSLVDEFVLVTEDEIKEAIRLLIERHHMLAEGSGALSVASFLKSKEKYEGRDVVLLVSGSKISLNDLREVLRGQA